MFMTYNKFYTKKPALYLKAGFYSSVKYHIELSNQFITDFKRVIDFSNYPEVKQFLYSISSDLK